jgi:small subunit ribosomal protein S16
LAVKLRLTRMGKKKQPFYRIVAVDSRTRRDGKYIEKIGHYNPITNPAEIVIDEEKAFYWLKNGAIPTDTVKNLLGKKGIMVKWHFMKHGHDGAKIEEEFKKWELLQIEKQKREEALAAQATQKKEQKVVVEEPVSEEAEPTVEESQPTPSQPESEIEPVEVKSESQSPEPEAEIPQVEEPTADEQKSAEPEDDLSKDK